jgi:hypothetical protein
MTDTPRKKLYHKQRDPLLSIEDVNNMIDAFNRKKKEEQEK